MLTLASMVWAAYMFCRSEMHMVHQVPPPVIIEKGEVYQYDNIYSTITVPADWKDDCKDQKEVVYKMAQHFNDFRNGNQKLSISKLTEVANSWVCIQ